MCDTPVAVRSILGAALLGGGSSDSDSASAGEGCEPLSVIFVVEGGGTLGVLQRSAAPCAGGGGGGGGGGGAGGADRARADKSHDAGKKKDKKPRSGAKKVGMEGKDSGQGGGGVVGEGGDWEWVLLIDTPERGAANVRATFSCFFFQCFFF